MFLGCSFFKIVFECRVYSGRFSDAHPGRRTPRRLALAHKHSCSKEVVQGLIVLSVLLTQSGCFTASGDQEWCSRYAQDLEPFEVGSMARSQTLLSKLPSRGYAGPSRRQMKNHGLTSLLFNEIFINFSSKSAAGKDS